MKILIVSDAWTPQINGVVRTLEATIRELENLGHDVRIITPKNDRLFTFAATPYPEIKLEFFAHRRLSQILDGFAPDCIHIATEGPLGWAARGSCLWRGKPFTTSYHTRFPEYLAARVPRFLARTVRYAAYTILRRFHAPSSAVMVATSSMEVELRAHKFRRLVRWTRGVDMDLFKPCDKRPAAYANLRRPVLLHVGRAAVEKSLPAFLGLKTSGSLVVIGDGPDLATLRKKYPHAHFLGSIEGENLAHHYTAADLFVFPSTTDTFGLVLLEACASGLRIAARPAPGPSDIFADPETLSFAVLNPDLQTAVDHALTLPDIPAIPRAFAARFSWASCTQQFLIHLQTSCPQAIRRLAHWRKKIGTGM